MRPVRVACIGSGFIAGRHLSSLAGFEEVDIVAVADTVEERARSVASAFGARAYVDGLDLLEQEELDAVWICVPPFAHGPLERAALRRDLPFFVEKPLGNDLATPVEIAGEVQRRRLLTSVGYHWRYLTVLEQARHVLQQSPPTLANGYWLDKTPAPPWWVCRSRSGGQMLEQTTHIFDLARLLLGEAAQIHAVEVAAPEKPLGDVVPLASSAIVRFRSGAIGTISSARMLHARHRVALHVMGEGYAVELSERSLTDHELRVATAQGTSVQQVDEDPIRCEDRAFLDTILGRGDDVRAPYAEALRTHALACAADRSAQGSGMVDLAPVQL